MGRVFGGEDMKRALAELFVGCTSEDRSGEEQTKLKEYLFPRVIEALDHPYRVRILQLLYEYPEGRVAFSEIKRALAITNNAALVHHLSILETAHLIENTIEIAPHGNRKQTFYSFYSLTKFGRELLQRLSTAFTKSLEMITTVTK